ncbi:MAG: winged helix-turn-helix transcriptional regulator [Elusimicrobiota bacterium]|nr:winged helix-turn-helix transcriptional regulator [Endomicrobiia bacterium]MDW8166684.1 winged helix-turn-helix transcriptional regulator [Elusimicrobiota bacterium]
MKSLLECKWALQIIEKLWEGPKRPSQLLKLIPDIPERVLYQRLKSLEREGIVFKETSSSYPLKTFYYLIKKDELEALIEILKMYKTNPIFYKLLSYKWIIPILETLKSPTTPKESLAFFKNIPEKIFYNYIKMLLKLGLIERLIIASRPVKILYRITPKGEALLASLIFAKNVILSIQKRHNPDS